MRVGDDADATGEGRCPRVEVSLDARGMPDEVDHGEPKPDRASVRTKVVWGDSVPSSSQRTVRPIARPRASISSRSNAHAKPKRAPKNWGAGARPAIPRKRAAARPRAGPPDAARPAASRRLSIARSVHQKLASTGP